MRNGGALGGRKFRIMSHSGSDYNKIHFTCVPCNVYKHSTSEAIQYSEDPGPREFDPLRCSGASRTVVKSEAASFLC